MYLTELSVPNGKKWCYTFGHRRSSNASVMDSSRKTSSELDASELQQRRLSEAGLRRSSTSDVVLNDQTTSLMVGMKVWVDGTKPGQFPHPVWPDVGVKSRPNVSKNDQKSSHNSVYIRERFYKIAQKVGSLLGYFCQKKLSTRIFKIRPI